MIMTRKYKKFSPEEKVRLLRLHLIEKEPISDICDRHGISPNVFYGWQKLFFENGAAALTQMGNGRKDSHAKKLERLNAQLKAKIANKDEVIAEIMASHIELKKSLGEI
jgi:transposase-like protein